MELDALDLELLAALQEDARMSNKELAARIGLAPSTTHTRLKRLTASGILRGTSIDVDPAALGLDLLALVFIRLEQHNNLAIADVWSKVVALEGVIAAWHVGGHDDIVLHVAVQGTAELRELVLDRLPGVGGVDRVRTELVFDHLRKPMPVPS